MVNGLIKKLLRMRQGSMPPHKREEPWSNILTGKSAVSVIDGCLEIPEGTTEIGLRAFEGRRELVSVSVPASVKRIGEGAFSGCANLERVMLREGLESIGRFAFSDCPKLNKLVIPDSAADVNGRSFEESRIRFPVLNASRDTLFYCPAEAAGSEFTVPEGVRRIGTWAFLNLSDLKKVHLPQTLERLDDMAFLDCGLESVVIPAGVRRIGNQAFCGCMSLGEVRVESGDDPVRTAVVTFRVHGTTFLAPIRCLPPESSTYWLDREFRALAETCGTGSPEAMDKMAAFFEEKHWTAPDEPYYPLASNFWRYRAYENGSLKHREWLESWIKASPGKRLPSACLDERLCGTFSGRALNALGFLFFDTNREYSLAGLDGEGVVEVSAYESEDGPDSDGYGRETYYDWWYLDSSLRPVPGADCLHGYSNIDRRIPEVKERFQKCHETAAKAVSREK